MAAGHAVPERAAPAAAAERAGDDHATASPRAATAPRVLHRCAGADCDDPCCTAKDELAVALQRAVTRRTLGPLLQRDKTRHPDQTCEDDVYDPGRDEIAACKLLATSCSDETERTALGITTRKQFNKLPASSKWSLNELDTRLANARRYLKARVDFQAACFAGVSDEGHDKAVTQLENAVATCEHKRAQREAELGGRTLQPEPKVRRDDSDDDVEDVNPRSRAGRRGQVSKVVEDEPKQGRGGKGKGGKGKGGKGGRRRGGGSNDD